MKVHVYSTPVVEWNKKRKEKKRKERQSIPTHPSVYINIYRGDTWMPSLENWDGGLKSLLWHVHVYSEGNTYTMYIHAVVCTATMCIYK